MIAALTRIPTLIVAIAICLSPANVVTAQTPDAPVQLEVGKPVERELKGSETHAYSVSLAARQYVSAVVVQNGADVVVTVFGPDGTQLFEQSGNARHLKQGTDAARPALQADGSILFNGTSHYLKCDAFTLNQPETVYILFKQVSWTNNDVLSDGNTTGVMYLFQAGGTPNLSLYAGTLLGTSTPLTLNTYGVSSAVYNGASSSLGINNNTRVTGDVGAGNAGGFTLGGNGGATVFGNIQVLEAIIFPAAHDATQRARVTRYLMGIGGV